MCLNFVGGKYIQLSPEYDENQIDEIYQYDGSDWNVIAYLNIGRSNHAVSVVKTDNLFNLCQSSFFAPVAPTTSKSIDNLNQINNPQSFR